MTLCLKEKCISPPPPVEGKCFRQQFQKLHKELDWRLPLGQAWGMVLPSFLSVLSSLSVLHFCSITEALQIPVNSAET